MKSVLLLSILLSGLMLSGCGAIKATESVPDKLDATNGEVKKTNSNMKDMDAEVKKTNSNMEEMNNEVKKTNSNMEDMNAEVKKTNEGIAKTNAAVHNQTLAVALAEMMKPENTKTLFPPMGMLPAGQVFATEATADEIVQLVYVLLKDVDSSQPDDSEKDQNGNWKPETVKTFDHEKSAKLTAAMVIMGLAPQATVEEMVKAQIDNGGRHEETTYKALMLRYAFTKDFMLDSSLFSTSLTNPGKIAEAVRFADQLDFISSLPCAAKVGLKTIGMLKDEDNVELSLSMYDTGEVWKKIDRAFDSELDERYKDPTSLKAAALAALRLKVKSHITAQ